MTFAPATIAQMIKANVKHNPNPNPNLNPHASPNQKPITTLTLTFCCRRYHRRSSCRQIKCHITDSNMAVTFMPTLKSILNDFFFYNYNMHFLLQACSVSKNKTNGTLCASWICITLQLRQWSKQIHIKTINKQLQ